MAKKQTLTFPEVVDIIDNSKLSHGKRCERYEMYSDVFGWHSKNPNIHLVHGNAWHHAHEFLALNGYHLDNLTEAFKHYTEFFRQFYPPWKDEDFAPKNPAFALKALKSYIQQYGESDSNNYELVVLNNIPLLEIGIPIPLGGDRVFYIKIDKVVKSKHTGKIVIFDHKTGSRVESYWAQKWGMRNQFFGYLHGINCIFPPEEVEGLIVDEAVFYKSQSSQHKRLMIRKNPRQMQDWLHNQQYWYDKKKRNLELLKQQAEEGHDIITAFPRNDEGCVKFFKLCPYFDHCHSTSNPLIDMNNPPDGMDIIHWDPRTEPVSARFNEGEIEKVEKKIIPKWSEGDVEPDAPESSEGGLFSSIVGK